MDVYEAVTSRRAVRGFTDRHVSREVLERVLSAAAWSPSASNLQPWHAYVLTGAPLAELKERTGERIAAGDDWDEPEYEQYPAALGSPYRERRSAFGEQRYGALGIPREDVEARQRAAVANWDCFGAPAALFCYIHRDLGRPQWSDVGMYLQTVMLLIRAEGLHSCPQMAWAKYRKSVAEVLSPPDELILFCGMSIGFENVAEGHTRTGRAPLDETVTFAEGANPGGDQSRTSRVSASDHQKKACADRFAVIGGTGLIGSRVVEDLGAAGHRATPHSLSTGVDTISGQGLEAAVSGADVVIDLTNSPIFDDASRDFFQTSIHNILAASERCGVQHVVILSIVGVDQVPDLDYHQAKLLQESILEAGRIPYSIIRATQSMECMDATLFMAADGDTVRLPGTPIQPIAAADVSTIVAEVAAGSPLNGVVSIAGPDVYPLDELARLTLTARSDERPVITDDTAGMFAAAQGRVLTARDVARVAPTRYTDWLS